MGDSPGPTGEAGTAGWYPKLERGREQGPRHTPAKRVKKLKRKRQQGPK